MVNFPSLIDEILTSDFSDVSSEAKSTMVFAISSGGLSEFKSFVPT